VEGKGRKIEIKMLEEVENGEKEKRDRKRMEGKRREQEWERRERYDNGKKEREDIKIEIVERAAIKNENG